MKLVVARHLAEGSHQKLAEDFLTRLAHSWQHRRKTLELIGTKRPRVYFKAPSQANAGSAPSAEQGNKNLIGSEKTRVVVVELTVKSLANPIQLPAPIREVTFAISLSDSHGQRPRPSQKCSCSR